MLQIDVHCVAMQSLIKIKLSPNNSQLQATVCRLAFNKLQTVQHNKCNKGIRCSSTNAISCSKQRIRFAEILVPMTLKGSHSRLFISKLTLVRFITQHHYIAECAFECYELVQNSYWASSRTNHKHTTERKDGLERFTLQNIVHGLRKQSRCTSMNMLFLEFHESLLSNIRIDESQNCEELVMTILSTWLIYLVFFTHFSLHLLYMNTDYFCFPIWH